MLQVSEVWPCTVNWVKELKGVLNVVGSMTMGNVERGKYLNAVIVEGDTVRPTGGVK